MKVAIGSDLHLEFGDLQLDNTDNADLLILAGDICTAKHLESNGELGKRYMNFFEHVAKEFPEVVYVMGNHEHYGYNFDKTATTIHSKLRHLNVNFLDNDYTCMGNPDCLVIGGTLWTDLNKGDKETVESIPYLMRDYSVITKGDSYKRLTPRDTIAEFNRATQFLDLTVPKYSGGCCMVVTHHAPSIKSIHPKYSNDTIVNGAYHSNLEDFIIDNPTIKLWVHGHTHTPFDYKIGEARVVCNPRGYIGHEATADNYRLKYIEL